MSVSWPELLQLLGLIVLVILFDRLWYRRWFKRTVGDRPLQLNARVLTIGIGILMACVLAFLSLFFLTSAGPFIGLFCLVLGHYSWWIVVALANKE